MGSEIASAKISGYLEKKGKLRVVAGWKKYWFVLEGRLLLYYRSKEEYEAISPCKGSISLGPPCCIKPALASTCIFQIESRSNTIILRADNRLEQDKWMQAILGALKPNANSPKKVSHFRYSADDLAKNGGLPNTSAKKHLVHIFSRQNTMPSRASTKKVTGVPEKSKLNVFEKLRKISSDSYVARSLENVSKATSKASPKLPKSQTLQRMLLNNSLQNLDTILVDNPKEQSQGAAEIEHRPKIVLNDAIDTVLVDNVEYCTSNEITPREKSIYTEPFVQVVISPDQKTDHNKNSVLIENPEYEPYKSRESLTAKLTGEENVYDECQYAAKRLSSKDITDDHYSVPELPPRVKSSSTEQLHEPKKPLKRRRRGTFRRLTQFGQQKEVVSKGPGVNKLGRTRSFVSRVLNKITSSKEEEQQTTAQLEQDRNDLGTEQRRVSEIQVLKEMQEVLNKRRQEIERVMPSDSNSEVLHCQKPSMDVSQQESPQLGDQVFKYEYDEDAYCVPEFLTKSKPKDFRPDLPPRQKLTDNYYHNLPCTPLPIEPFYIPRLKLKRPRSIQKLDQPQKLKTIDEILDDLDKEKSLRDHLRQSSEEQPFDQHLNCDSYDKNQSKSTDELVTLRKDYTISRSGKLNDDFRYSDDLNSLLEELCKVTNAPILNTNATSSLIYHTDTADEWFKLIPIRKRTYSDPDYDVPRPHSSAKFVSHQLISLQLLPTEDIHDQTQNVIEVISPQTIKDINPSSIEEDRSVTSYTSHQYAKELPLPIFKTSSSVINNILEGCESKSPELDEDYDSADIELQEINTNKLLNNNNNNNNTRLHSKVKEQQYETQQVCHTLVEDYTYASPRSFVSFDHMINECEHTIQMKIVNRVSASANDDLQGGKGGNDMGEDEVFADSLEPYDLQQISTEF